MPHIRRKQVIFFADDNIIANKAFAKELCLAIRPLQHQLDVSGVYQHFTRG